ncbi:MAG TPA: tetratricopeptide repeat protein [Gemmataceae bacterium]|nr:tetratricopeptide repeat protein [Gemmataceae bacterium]
MAERPYRVFLSAASLDLKSLRQAAPQILKQSPARICKHGPLEVVFQEDFPPDYRDVWAILRQRILECDAVICLVGYAFGREPRNVPPGFSRRSYTQMEFDIARALGKPVFLFRADDAKALDPHEPEGEDVRKLQEQYREELRTLDQVRHAFKGKDELLAQLQKLELPPPAPRKPINLPYKTLGTLFKGRDDFLKDLREKLGAGDGRAVRVLAAQALYGLGGVGKTRLAIEYGWRNQGDYTALLFVSADTPANLRRNLAELVGPFVLDLKEAQEAKEEVRVAAALDWLQAHPGWFLILDNVDTEEAALEVERLVTGLQRGHVVITSRLKEWGAGVEPLELDVLDGAASKDFLLERTARRRPPTPSDEGDAQGLATALDGLALALEQAGAYISHVRCSLAEYLARWRKQEEHVLTWFDVRQMKYPASVAITWETTWDQLSPAARTLLEILAWFAPDPIPDSVLLGESTRPLAQAALAGADVALALADLDKYSCLKREQTAERSSLLVHRLVQEITRWRLPAGTGRQRLEGALQLVNAAAVGDPEDVRTWPVWVLLSSHVHTVVEHADHAEIAEPTARLMNNLGLLLQTKALHAEAEPLMRRALAIYERSLGPDHTNVAICLNNLAGMLRATNRLAEAEPLYRRALAIDERSFGPDHSEVATDLNNLAQLLQATNRLAEAEPLLRRALVIDERSFGPDLPEVATALNNLAGLLQATNRLTEAEPLMRRVVDIFTKSLGEDQPNVGTAVNNLAAVLQSTNRLAEAEPLMRRALAIDEHSFGPDHLKVAIRLNNLAALLRDTNRLAEAEPLSWRMVGIFLDFTRRTGHEHPHLQAALANYTGILKALGWREADSRAELE